MKSPKPLAYYFVRHIDGNEILYSGTSEFMAAEAWVPGTVYGRSDTPEGAARQATHRAEVCCLIPGGWRIPETRWLESNSRTKAKKEVPA